MSHYTNNVPYASPGEVENAGRTVRMGKEVHRFHNGALVLTDDAGRETIISAEGLRVFDAAGLSLLGTPTAPLNSTYILPMGQYYQFTDQAAFLLVNNASFTSGAWNTGQQAVLLSNANVVGARVRVYAGVGSAGGAGTAIILGVRPTGTSWDVASGSVCPMRVTETPDSISYDDGIFDVPLDANGQFDWYAAMTSATRWAYVSQLGVWIA